MAVLVDYEDVPRFYGNPLPAEWTQVSNALSPHVSSISPPSILSLFSQTRTTGASFTHRHPYIAAPYGTQLTWTWEISVPTVPRVEQVIFWHAAWRSGPGTLEARVNHIQINSEGSWVNLMGSTVLPLQTVSVENLVFTKVDLTTGWDNVTGLRGSFRNTVNTLAELKRVRIYLRNIELWTKGLRPSKIHMAGPEGTIIPFAEFEERFEKFATEPGLADRYRALNKYDYELPYEGRFLRAGEAYTLPTTVDDPEVAPLRVYDGQTRAYLKYPW